MPSERRIDQRITVAPTVGVPSLRHDLIVFRNSWGGTAQTFDPADISLLCSHAACSTRCPSASLTRRPGGSRLRAGCPHKPRPKAIMSPASIASACSLRQDGSR